MPNPRRLSLNQTDTNSTFQTQTLFSNQNNKFINFFKRPLAFPFLLSALLFLTWLSLRLQHSSSSSSPQRGVLQYRQFSKEDDLKANLVRFVYGSDSFGVIMKDKRGWMFDPVKLAIQSGLKGGAVSCASAHIGEIRPGALRGNHRHHTTNETFVLWGAKTRFRLENSDMDKGYAEVTIGADDVIVAVSPSGTAHALINVDPARSTFLLGCQDGSSSTSDYKVWKDL